MAVVDLSDKLLIAAAADKGGFIHVADKVIVVEPIGNVISKRQPAAALRQGKELFDDVRRFAAALRANATEGVEFIDWFIRMRRVEQGWRVAGASGCGGQALALRR